MDEQQFLNRLQVSCPDLKEVRWHDSRMEGVYERKFQLITTTVTIEVVIQVWQILDRIDSMLTLLHRINAIRDEWIPASTLRRELELLLVIDQLIEAYRAVYARKVSPTLLSHGRASLR